MDKQNERIVQIQNIAQKENIDLVTSKLNQKQKELLLISDLKYNSSALNVFKQFEYEQKKQIVKVKEFTKHFESLVEQSQQQSSHISELQTSSNTIKTLMDQQIHQVGQMNESSNDLRLHCEQTLNLMGPLIQQSREQISQINPNHICEVRNLKRLPQPLLKYLQLLVGTLYNDRNLDYGELIKYLLNTQKISQDWLDFNIENITDEQIRDIRANFNPEDEHRIRGQSSFGHCIFNWIKKIDQVYIEIWPAKSQLQLLSSNIQKINKQIQDNGEKFSQIENGLQQLKLQFIELNGIVNENRSQYDFQVLQKSAYQVVREIIQKLEARVNQLEIEIENVDVLGFVESAYNQQFKKFESNKCESLIRELDFSITLGMPIEYKLNYCYSNLDQLVVFVFDPYQVGKLIFEIMSHNLQSVCLAISTEQQIAESSQIIHFIHNQQEFSQITLRDNEKTKRNLFFIFDRGLFEQLKQVSMDNYVNLELNEADLTFIYSSYSLNQQYTIGLQQHNDKFKDQVDIILNNLNQNELENFQIISNLKVKYYTDQVSLQQLDEQLPQFCSRLFFLLQEKKKTQFPEIANSILSAYQTKPTTPMIYSFKYAFDYALQYMPLSQTFVHKFDDKSEQTLLGLLIHKASMDKQFELSQQEQQKIQKVCVFCSKFLNLNECNIFELISKYIQQKQIYYQLIQGAVQELDSVSKIYQCISKQRESTNVLKDLIVNNQNLLISIQYQEKEIKELKGKIDILHQKIRDNQDVISLNKNQLKDLNKQLANKENNLIYSGIYYLNHTADPDQLTLELFSLLMVLMDKDSTWASIKNNTNSKVKINIFNKYKAKRITKHFVDKFNIFKKNQQRLVQTQPLNAQAQKLFKFLEFLSQKFDLYQEKLQIQDYLKNCRQNLKQDNFEYLNNMSIYIQQVKILEKNQSLYKQNEQLIKIEVSVLDCLNKNQWFEDYINQIHSNKLSTLNLLIEQQIISSLYQTCEIEFQKDFLRVPMSQEQQVEQNPIEFLMLVSEKYMDFVQTKQTLSLEASLNLKQVDLDQQYFQNSQTLKYELVKKIEFKESENIRENYLNLFVNQCQQIIVKLYKNIKINIQKAELLKQPLLEFTTGLAAILIQSHNVEYSSVLDLVTAFIQKFYVNQTFSRNEFLKQLIYQASTQVKVEQLGQLYIQVFILFIYVYLPGKISKLEMAQILIKNQVDIPILEWITPQDSLASIMLGLDNRLENIFGEDRFRFCEL